MSAVGNTRGPTEDLHSPGGSRVGAVRVEAAEGPGRGAAALLEVGTLVVGSSSGCDLRVRDPAVSGRHLTVELLPGAVRVRDLGSKNGTRYLGARISEAVVPVGASVSIGRTVLRFLLPAESARLSEREELEGLVGRSPKMRELFAVLEKLASAEATVLVEGETGTGKDAVARALHRLSPRAAGPFVVFDCAAVSPHLVESELFGHVRGAFTGAVRARAGAAEVAHRGTLFLDEVGELPYELQAKLLRLLEAREFKRVGDSVVRRSTARVVAATHRDLREETRAGRFRADLYHRLSVAVVQVPALKERAEDIPLLVRRFARELAGFDVELGAATLAAFQCDPWPGNVRELRNAVERCLALGAQPAAAREREVQTPAPASFHQARAELLEQFEKDYLSALLRRHRGQVSPAAREAGLARSHLYRLLERHGLKAKSE